MWGFASLIGKLTLVKELKGGVSKARVQFQVEAKVKEVAVVLCTPESDLATASIEGTHTA